VYADEEQAGSCSAVLLLLHAKPLQTSFFLFIFSSLLFSSTFSSY